VGDSKSKAAELGIGRLNRHILICRGPECCDLAKGEKVWSYLKSRLKELNVTAPKGGVYRSKVDCLKICTNGPIVLIYPEGLWYDRVDIMKMESIIQQHVLKKNVKNLEPFCVNPLD
jgi:(2Fe-2S) ferredoxin